MRVIVTRPAKQAETWVRWLRDAGIEAVALPLIAIEPPRDAAPLRDAWRTIDGFAMAMFVSANAVEHFVAQRAAGAAWPAQLLAGSTGPGTSAALREAGVPPQLLVEPPGPDFDSEALWQRLRGRDWQGRRVLVLRGQDGRDWLSQQLGAAGAQVLFAESYVRSVPALDGDQRAVLRQALAAPAAHRWLFSSSQAVRHLRELAPGADWSASRAWATHARVAEAVRAARFGEVGVVESTLPELLSRLRSARSCSIQSDAS